MKISIITVCFNSEKTIRNTIESVLGQSYRDIEYIVIDGESTDATLSIIEEYRSSISRLVSEPDLGIYDAMNKGISHASGELVGILNSDDFYIHTNVITEVVSKFLYDRELSFVLGGVDFVRDKDTSKVVRCYPSLGFKPWKLYFGLMPPHPGAFVKRAVYHELGSYKIDYEIGADFDFFVRTLLLHNQNYMVINDFLVRMRVGGVSTSGLKSYLKITREFSHSLRVNSVFSSQLLIFSRFIFKLKQVVFWE